MKHGNYSWSLSNISFKYRLPLLIGTLLAAVIIACNWAAYRAVRASALEVGRERLQNLTQQLSGLLQQSASNVLTKTAAVANDTQRSSTSAMKVGMRMWTRPVKPTCG